MEILAQIFGLVGMVFNLLAFQQKSHRGVVLCQLFAASSFCVNYFMLGALVGGLLNLFGILRAIVFFFKEKTRADHVGWLIFFTAVFVASYPLVFLVFGTPPVLRNLIVELLPVLAMILITVSLRMGSAKAVRRLGLFSSPLWLTYNAFSGSIGAIISEVLNLISIIVGILRFDTKRNKQDPAAP